MISNKTSIKQNTDFGLSPDAWKAYTILQLTDGSKMGFNDGDWVESRYLSDSGVRLIQTGNIGVGTFKDKKNKKFISPKSFEELKCSSIFPGDILICRLADPAGRACVLPDIGENQLITSVDVSIFRPDISLANRDFLTLLFSTVRWLKLVKERCGGSTRSRIARSELAKIKFPLPPLNEQDKIASILASWNDSISKNGQLLENLLLRRRQLDQQLLSGQVRFKEFVKSEQKTKTKVGILPLDWELMSISEIVDRVKEKLIPESDMLYREIGIRSHCKGIFHKEEVTGESLGNKSVFWIQPDCFVVNIVFAWEHAIAKTTDSEVGMIASHRFPLYKPKADILDLDYLLFYFKTARGKHLLGLASPGGAGRNKTLGQTEFAKLKIPVPSLEEQKRIVSVLSESDKEIELLKQHIATLKEQKKGLMQKLLTGEIRVKVDG